MRLNIILLVLITLYANTTDDLKEKLETDLDTLMPKVIEWRHDIHQYPELGNQEFRTSNKIKVHLENPWN
jgi:Metal-dependent amidase/aminoacylase/carboxypeptidase